MRAPVATSLVAAALLALAGTSSAAASQAPALAEPPAGTSPPAGTGPATGSTPAATGSPAGASPATGAITRLSNETTLTTWAHPEVRGEIRLEPNPRAHGIAPVRLYTEDGFPEVYVMLSSFVDPAGREWAQVRIPGRPNGRTGWMLRELLGAFHRTRWRIVVNRERRRMSVYYGGRLRRVFPVGVGKPSTPTPPGRYWLRERFRLSSRSSPYWPYALGTSDYSTLSEWPGGGVIGIHGDFGEPSKIPGDPSHGCIRMHDADIAWLGPRVTLGTPVDIL
jgi:L,D-transpeptidase catalytic domain